MFLINVSLTSKARKTLTRLLIKLIDVHLVKEHLEKDNHTRLSKMCIIDNTSKFYTEAGINNLQHDRNKIIIGRQTHIRGHLQLFAQAGEITIGNNCYVGENSKIWSAEKIDIGNRVLIAHNVNIHDNISHPLDSRLRHRDYLRILGIIEMDLRESDLRPSAIVIKDDAWIGFNVTVLKGVTIGKGAIIGAGSIITKDVPDFAIVIGNPATILKFTT